MDYEKLKKLFGYTEKDVILDAVSEILRSAPDVSRLAAGFKVSELTLDEIDDLATVGGAMLAVAITIGNRELTDLEARAIMHTVAAAFALGRQGR